MDSKKFDVMAETNRPRRNLIWQDWGEWQMFLEFAAAYFRNRAILCPIVVEIGIMFNEQRAYYKEFMRANHIGIDINVNNQPDICGDSADPAVTRELRRRLDGRMIDLLFIDGNHTAQGVRNDFEIYGPLTKGLIAVHDVHAEMTHVSPVNEYWNNLVAAQEFNTVMFHRFNQTADRATNKYMNMGIGVIVKG